MTLGEKIYGLRKNNGLSQEQLAEILNVSRQSISKWEGNVTYPEPDKLIALSDYFQVSLDYLMKADVTEERFKEEDAPECVTEVVGAEMKQSEKQSGKLIYPPNILIGGRYDEKKQTKQIEESAWGFPQCDRAGVLRFAGTGSSGCFKADGRIFYDHLKRNCIGLVASLWTAYSRYRADYPEYPPNILIGGQCDEKKQTKQIEESACGFPQCDPCAGDSVFYRNRVDAPRRCVYR